MTYTLLLFCSTIIFTGTNFSHNKTKPALLPLCNESAFNTSNPSSNDTIKNKIMSIASDYGSPTIEISGTVFDLSKRRVAPSSTKGIMDIPNWLSPKGAGMTFLVTYVFQELNAAALNRNYTKAVERLINISYANLKSDTGQLIRISFNTNEFGIADVNSVRVEFQGIGMSPEQSLAEGPIDQISSYYPTNIGHPIANTQYIWIKKNIDNNLEITTIKDPFIENIKTKALEIKENSLKDQESVHTFTDPNLDIFDRSRTRNEHVRRFENQLAEAGILEEVNRLNAQMAEEQSKMRELKTSYDKMLEDQAKTNFVNQIINICESVNDTYKDLSSPTKGLNEFERSYLKSAIESSRSDIKKLKIQISKNENKFENLFKQKGLPKPIYRLP